MSENKNAIYGWFGHNRSVTGRSHIDKNGFCEDSSLVEFSKSVAIAVVSDGAGSVKKAKLGSTTVVETTKQFLQKTDNWIAKSHKQIAKQLIQENVTALEREAKEHNCSILDLACTLCFVAVSENNVLCGNLGDGVVGGFKEKSFVLIKPLRGEFANTTVFIQGLHSAKYLCLLSENLSSLNGFILMSDGASDSLFDRRQNTLAAAVNVVFQWYNEYSSDEIEQALDDSVMPMLTSKTRDDCSIAILRRAKITEKKLQTLSVQKQKQILGVKNKIGLKNRLNVLKEWTKNVDIKKIIEKIGLTKRTIKNHLRELIKRGLCTLK